MREGPVNPTAFTVPRLTCLGRGYKLIYGTGRRLSCHKRYQSKRYR